jgi:hypothetical protein
MATNITVNSGSRDQLATAAPLLVRPSSIPKGDEVGIEQGMNRSPGPEQAISYLSFLSDDHQAPQDGSCFVTQIIQVSCWIAGWHRRWTGSRRTVLMISAGAVLG